MLLDFGTGRFDDAPPQSRRTVADLASIFASVEGVDPETVVYETFGCPSEIEGPTRLLFATTVLHPGHVNGEFHMTRGHFHTRPDRGELMLTLRGTGLLVLMDRDGRTWTESMAPGSTYDIDGAHAHRVVNNRSEPLVFFVAWMSDCGHDYASIQSSGFGDRFLIESN